MNSTTSASHMAELLLAGPRGRRFLLEYALASELAQHPVRGAESFGQAASDAAHHLDPDSVNSRVLRRRSFFGWVAPEPEPEVPNVSAAGVATRLDLVELLEPTPEMLRHALRAAVDSARYWQEPDGEDRLAATPQMRQALQRVAEHVAASALTAWWWTPVDRSAQHCVLWDDAPPRSIPDDIHATLRAASDRQRTEERLARVERDPDPTANWSGEWGSHPSLTVPSSTRALFDGSPAGLWCVEDSLGWEQAETVRLLLFEDVSVFEIADAADWAELCGRFPLEVTAQKRHDWYRTTGHTGPWIVPDWAQVAEYYHAVHLQVGAYLSASGTAIPVDNSTDAVSVIAGWGPDETYWFSSDIAYGNDYIRWVLIEDESNMVWQPESTGSPHQLR